VASSITTLRVGLFVRVTKLAVMLGELGDTPSRDQAGYAAWLPKVRPVSEDPTAYTLAAVAIGPGGPDSRLETLRLGMDVARDFYVGA
jgi:hypothetical protein